jgi:hypothetical protein
MSVTTQQKMLCVASAASLSAMGFLMAVMAPAPAGASPMLPLDPAVPCDGYTFPAGFTIKQSDGSVITVSNPAGSADFSGAQATLTGGGKTTTGHAHGGSAGGVNLDFTIDWDGGASTHYTGVVATSFGNGQGDANSSTGGSLVWSSKPQTLNCVRHNQPQQQTDPNANNNPPANNLPTGNIDVIPNQGKQNITFAVTNKSSVPVQCTYEAKKTKGLLGPGETDRNFPLAVGASTTLTFLEIPLGTTYHVAIDCKGDQFQSAFVQDFTG